MAKFRSVPTEVEAARWRGPGSERPAGLRSDGRGFFVVTAHGERASVAPGDYVVLEPSQPAPDGGVAAYPCKADIFVRRYEPCPDH